MRATVLSPRAFVVTRIERTLFAVAHGADAARVFPHPCVQHIKAAVLDMPAAATGPEQERRIGLITGKTRDSVGHTGADFAVRDGLSLWHVLPHLDSQARGRAYDRLAQLFPPPPEVTREGIVALDPKMLGTWKQVVSQLWQ